MVRERNGIRKNGEGNIADADAVFTSVHRPPSLHLLSRLTLSAAPDSLHIQSSSPTNPAC